MEQRPRAEAGRVSEMDGSAAAAKPAAKKRLLVIDDEQSICEFIRRVAESQGFEVATAITHDQFRSAYDAFKPSAILLDLMMPNVDGVALLEKLAKQGCAAKLLIMSQVVLSLQLSFAVFPLVKFTSDPAKMGAFVNPGWLKVLSWSVAWLILGLNVWLLIMIFRG